MDPYSSWIGIGVKTGGTLIFGGYESFTGGLFNLGTGKVQGYTFTCTNYRLGLGLGGGGGLAAAFLFNAKNPRVLNDKWAWDWGFNLAIGGKVDDVVDAAKWGKMIKRLSEISKHAKNLKPEQLEAARNLGSSMASASNVKGSQPAFTAIDIPLAGAGLEVSLHALYGKLEVS